MTEQEPTYNTLDEWFDSLPTEGETFHLDEIVCSDEEADLARLHGEHRTVFSKGNYVTFTLYNGKMYITEFKGEQENEE